MKTAYVLVYAQIPGQIKRRPFNVLMRQEQRDSLHLDSARRERITDLIARCIWEAEEPQLHGKVAIDMCRPGGENDSRYQSLLKTLAQEVIDSALVDISAVDI